MWPTHRGVLLYGPSGTGKTALAAEIARLANVPMFALNGAEVFSGFVGGSEAKIRDIFRVAASASPSLVFIDAIDAMCPKREEGSELEGRVVGTLLAAMDGVTRLERVVVIAATSKPSALDAALRRPGRFDRCGRGFGGVRGGGGSAAAAGSVCVSATVANPAW